MQHALQLAEPVNKLPLQLDVLPSNMPAELLMTFQGEVSSRGIQGIVSQVDNGWLRGLGASRPQDMPYYHNRRLCTGMHMSADLQGDVYGSMT
jgi:hypothetical protein